MGQSALNRSQNKVSFSSPGVPMARVQINYLDRYGKLLASHVTDDEYEPGAIENWRDWLTNGLFPDDATKFPGAPSKWANFELVAALAPCSLN